MLKRILLVSIFCLFIFIETANAQKNYVQGIKILSKPSPTYTDEARKKNVSGWVQLRIAFKANGEIGEIIYVKESSKKKKLTRYGLVAQAIEAAKKIKFEPTLLNGQQTDASAIIEYAFTLY